MPAAEVPMKALFVQIKCQLGRAYEVANAIADAEIASEIYSTAGEFDLLVKFYLDDEADPGRFVTEQVQSIDGIKDTLTIMTFRAF
jgi:DNA-binding Lrp family transcriptional regulator